MKRSLIALLLVGGWPAASLAVEGHHPSAGAAAPAAASLTEGEVRKVDKESSKMTIRHGPIQNLGMPPMTMVFQVKDPSLLDKVKVGDKIRFSAEKVGNAFTVTGVEQAK